MEITWTVVRSVIRLQRHMSGMSNYVNDAKTNTVMNVIVENFR